MSPPVTERVYILDVDRDSHSTIKEASKTLGVSLHVCENGSGPETLRGQRYLLAFASFSNDSFLQQEGPHTGLSRFVVLTTPAAKAKALGTVGTGVFGFLIKPFQLEEVDTLIRRALEIQRVQRELNRLRTLESLSEAMMDRLRNIVRKADPSKKGDVFDFVKRCIEKPLLEMVLEETGGNRLKAAKVLGINRNTLRTRLRELGIELPRSSRPNQ